MLGRIMAVPPKKTNYDRALEKYGPGPKALRWRNYRTAAVRYRSLLVGLEIQHKSVLDVGCGMGDLLPYLHAQTQNFSYLGVDINKDFIDIARQRYEGHDFKVLDPFTSALGTTYDIVVLSGALNANEENWLENRKRKISALYELANEAAVFNMAGGLEELPNTEQIAYASVRDILDFCSTLTPNLVLQTQYLAKDFTITLFK
jgi:SAM-dependent methyltransferase